MALVESAVTGTDSLVTGTDSLVTGIDSLVTDTNSLVTGTNSVVTGTDSLVTDKKSLVTGTNSLVTGTDSLVTGTNSLVTGTDSHVTGADFTITASQFLSPEDENSWKKIAIALLLSAIVIFTVTSNLTVLSAFYLEKKLRNTFTYFIANLAVTDFMVGLIAMTFYTIDTVLGFWPFGEVMCGLWIFSDYCMIFASVLTLVAISVDRYWCVRCGLHYHKHNTKRKSTIIIICIWVTSVIICLPPCVFDRLKWSEPNTCWWDPHKNEAFAYYIAVVGFYLPCVVIIFCYIRVIILTRKKLKIKPRALNQGRSNLARAGPSTSGFQQAGPSSSHNSAVAGHEKVSEASNAAVKGRMEVPIKGIRIRLAAADAKAEHDTQKRMKQERKIFVTMSFILITYMICWVPFHFIFSLSLLAPGVISSDLFVVGFWMTYLNSALNPLVYAVSNKEYRKVIKGVITCKYMK